MNCPLCTHTLSAGDLCFHCGWEAEVIDMPYVITETLEVSSGSGDDDLMEIIHLSHLEGV